jgi:hypothetical protein
LALALARRHVGGFKRSTVNPGRPPTWLEQRGLQFWAEVEIRIATVKEKDEKKLAKAAVHVRDNSDLSGVFFEDKIEDGLRAFKRNIRKSDAFGHIFEEIAAQHRNLPSTVSKKERAKLIRGAEAKWVIENFGNGRIFGEDTGHLLDVFGVKTGENSG